MQSSVRLKRISNDHANYLVLSNKITSINKNKEDLFARTRKVYSYDKSQIFESIIPIRYFGVQENIDIFLEILLDSVSPTYRTRELLLNDKLNSIGLTIKEHKRFHKILVINYSLE